MYSTHTLSLSSCYVRALAVNREWVRENITKKQGLAIPENFRQTAPAHDPVRTMGHQEKQEASTLKTLSEPLQLLSPRPFFFFFFWL
jgi:hypothetical protein